MHNIMTSGKTQCMAYSEETLCSKSDLGLKNFIRFLEITNDFKNKVYGPLEMFHASEPRVFSKYFQTLYVVVFCAAMLRLSSPQTHLIPVPYVCYILNLYNAWLV